MLGRAKWDSWNKQKGSKKVDAKTGYVTALIRVSALKSGKTAFAWRELSVRSCANTLRVNQARVTSQNWRHIILIVSDLCQQ